MRSDISSVILTMKKLGIENLVRFDFMDPPAPETMMRALENLNYLGALDDEGELTKIGNEMAELPLDPQLSKALLSSSEYGCVPEMLTITAMLSIPPPFLRPRESVRFADEAKSQFVHTDSDHITLLNLYNAFVEVPAKGRSQWCYDNYISYRSISSALNVRRQLEGILRRLHYDVTNGNHFESPYYFTNIKKSIFAGFFMQVAHRERTGHYLTIKDNQVVKLYPSSVLKNKPDWVMFHEFVLTTANYMRTVTAVDGEWLMDIAPQYYDLSSFPDCSAKNDIIAIERRKKLIKENSKRRKH